MIPDRVSRLRPLLFLRAFVCAFVLLAWATAPSGAAAAADGGALAKLDDLSAVVHVRATLPEGNSAEASRTSAREGNGVVIDSSGLILTLRYLIRRASKVEVTDQSGKVVPAKIVGFDQTTGFGLIKAEGLAAKPMRLGDSNSLPDAMPLLAVSHGKGQPAVTPTRLVTRYDYAAASEYMVEKSILTYPSHDNFSGAALINEEGRLVGLGSIALKAGSGQDSISTNLWLPINGIKPVLADLIEHGSRQGPRHPWLGLRGQEVDGHLLVVAVEDNSPGDKAGIKVGDMILGIDGKRVNSLVDYYRQVWSRGDAGAVIPLNLLRFKSESVGIDRVEVKSVPFDEPKPPGRF
jgi:S1-C subfamily serine protease